MMRWVNSSRAITSISLNPTTHRSDPRDPTPRPRAPTLLLLPLVLPPLRYSGDPERRRSRVVRGPAAGPARAGHDRRARRGRRRGTFGARGGPGAVASLGTEADGELSPGAMCSVGGGGVVVVLLLLVVVVWWWLWCCCLSSWLLLALTALSVDQVV